MMHLRSHRACFRYLFRALIAATVTLLPLIAQPALAQMAPAGNAHPDAQEVSQAQAANPFGEADDSAPLMDGEHKLKFSKEVDLDPLRDLAVFHNGRVKIVDTLAKETVSTITGKSRYFDYQLKPDGKSALRVRYDPVFTWLDMMIDPDYYLNRPLVGVDFLPLREAFLEKLFTDPGEIEWWKRDGRLKPADIARVWSSVVAEKEFEAPSRRSLGQMREALEMFQLSWQNLLLVAPDGVDKPWIHVSDPRAGAAVGGAFKDLAAAWRAGDAPKVNAAVRSIASTMPSINPSLYPTTKRSMEAVYNRSNAFEWGFWLYAFSLLGLLLAFGTGRKWLMVFGAVCLAGAWGLHAFGFGARCIIAERFAIQNQFESMTGLSLFATTVGIVLMLVRRQWLFGAAAAAVGFMVLVTATQTGIPGVSVEREAPILNTSVLLKYHVTTVLLSYGLIALGFVVSAFYLITHYAGVLQARSTTSAALPGGGAVELSAAALGLGDGTPRAGARVLHDLDRAQMIILQLAFWGLGVGILLGAWWADHSWGRWWAFDPKELWALVTWIVYLIVIHLRFTTKNRGLVTAWMSIIGFIVMLWTYFGVNLLLPGLHAYA